MGPTQRRRAVAISSLISACGLVCVLLLAGLVADQENCIDQMYANVKRCLQFATEECPLLIETPAAENGELCANISSMICFFDRFDSKERKVLGICIDTCHVYQAGYMPLNYIKKWLKRSSIPIRLIHFNDSQRSRGCCVDSHKFPGQGEIGVCHMLEVAKFACRKNIPCVLE